MNDQKPRQKLVVYIICCLYVGRYILEDKIIHSCKMVMYLLTIIKFYNIKRLLWNPPYILHFDSCMRLKRYDIITYEFHLTIFGRNIVKWSRSHSFCMNNSQLARSQVMSYICTDAASINSGGIQFCN